MYMKSIFCLSKNIVCKNIANPLNGGAVHYHSVDNDGSSSVKIIVEKKLSIMKTARKGEVKFHQKFSLDFSKNVSNNTC